MSFASNVALELLLLLLLMVLHSLLSVLVGRSGTARLALIDTATTDRNRSFLSLFTYHIGFFISGFRSLFLAEDSCSARLETALLLNLRGCWLRLLHELGFAAQTQVKCLHLDLGHLRSRH